REHRRHLRRRRAVLLGESGHVRPRRRAVHRRRRDGVGHRGHAHAGDHGEHADLSTGDRGECLMGDVVAAYCVPPIHEGMVHTPFVASLMNVVSYDSNHGRRLLTVMVATHCYIPQGRMDIVKDFLAMPDAEWLWFLDYDLVFAPDA